MFLSGVFVSVCLRFYRISLVSCRKEREAGQKVGKERKSLLIWPSLKPPSQGEYTKGGWKMVFLTVKPANWQK